MDYAFQIGARGFLVGELQEALGIHPDERYGSDTAVAVTTFARNSEPEARRRMADEDGALFGRAGRHVFEALGLDWPELFARCMNLSMTFEGTGFAGSCGPAQTGDTAGVTYGAIGFTSDNAELQSLMREARTVNEAEFDAECLRWLDDKRRLQFYNYISKGANSDLFAEWGLDELGNVREPLKNLLRGLGRLDWMRRLQMKRAHHDYWVRAANQVRVLFGDTVTNARVFALLFDIGIQNGGLKTDELELLSAQFRNGLYDERERMSEICTLLTTRLRNKGRSKQIIEDVRSRKGAILNGQGVVHGDLIKVGSFAL